VVIDSRDSGVLIIAAVAEDGSGGQRWQRRTMTMAKDNGMQDWVADYKGDRQERAARDGGYMEWQ
jgi:hypothetical protein